MSRFTRPTFTTPAIPKPPAAVARVNALVAQAKALVNSFVQIPTLSIGAFLSMIPAVARARAQIAIQEQNLLKTKARLLAMVPVPPIPDLGVSLEELKAYRDEANNLLNQAKSATDEFDRLR